MGHPLEDVSLCESLRCMWGGCESRVYVLWDLVVLGFPFLSFSKRVFERGWGGHRVVRGGSLGVDLVAV